MFRLLFVYTIGLLLLLGATNVAGVADPHSAHTFAKGVYIAAAKAQRNIQTQVPKDHPRYKEHGNIISGLEDKAREHGQHAQSTNPTSRTTAQNSGLRADAVRTHTEAQAEHIQASNAWLGPGIVTDSLTHGISADHVSKAEEHHREVMRLMGSNGGARKQQGGEPVPWMVSELRPSRDQARKSKKEAEDSKHVAKGIQVVAQSRY